MHSYITDKRQKILIVDDRSANLLALEQTLLNTSVDIIKAESGDEALLASLDHSFALAILDVQMPGMDGYELATLLRSDSKTAILPIIFLTANNDSSDQVFKGYESGGVDYLVKPFDPRILLSKVSVFLQLDQQRTELTQQSLLLEQRVQERTSEIESKNLELRLAGLVLENILDGVMIIDVDRRIIRVNPAFSQITGFNKEDVIGQMPEMFFSERYSTNFFDHLVRELKNAGQWNGEVWSRSQSGRKFPVWMSVVFINGGINKTSHYVVSFKDQTIEKEYKERLNFLAYYDALTGLPNRDLLQDRLEHAILRASRTKTKAALLFLDLDRFKTINDTLGHSIGDELLAFTAAILTQCVRESDTVARLGGDEFMIIIEGVRALTDASSVAEKILSTVNTTAFVHGENELYINFSIGISLYPDNGTSAETLLKLSDTAMYRAKATGSGAYCFYTAEMSSQFQHRLQLETDLKRAVENGELLLHYQPQVNISTGQIIGCEALVRWCHPEHGMVRPDQFIAIAEDTGLIHPLGEWVLNEATGQAMRWREKGHCDLRVAVNFSSLQLLQPHSDRLLSLVSERAVGNCLNMELEITESVFLMHNDAVIDVLNRFREIGFTVSIDDFGTGYSSLAYLKRLPIDKLKIAMPFVQDVVANPDDAAIATAIIQMGHTLRMSVIAEGVETREQFNFLRNQGCDEIQGYLFSRPITADQFSGLLDSGRLLQFQENADELCYV